MRTFSFGQPDGGLCQIAFVVANIHTAIEQFTRTLNAGPWLFTERAQVNNALYRGKPTDFRGSTAVANTGHMQIEVIQQADDTPSVYTEAIKTSGYGFHHLGIAVRDFDAQLEEYADSGYEVAFYLETGVNRIAYMDTKGEFPFFVKAVEVTDRIEEIFTALYRASVEWDGKEPIRDFGWLSGLLSK